jgi:hypothetical protein
MNEYYTYDEIYGTLLHSNEDDTARTYFIIECLTHKFHRWMLVYGWNKVGKKSCERNGNKGFEIVLRRSNAVKNNPTQ